MKYKKGLRLIKRSKHQFFEGNENAKENFYKDFINDLIGRNSENKLGELLTTLNSKFSPVLEDAFLIYSNDPFIDIIMYRFVENADEDLKEKMQSIYIGKVQKDDEANAVAITRDGNFEGYLIEFYFELEYILFNVGEAYSAFILSFFDEGNVDSNLMLEITAGNISCLPDQNINGMVLSLGIPDAQRKLYGQLAMDAFMAGTAFVIAHEIGHHMLRHTENSLQPNMNIRGGNINHEYEFCADEFALRLMYKRVAIESNDDFSMEYLLGPVFVILAMALNDLNPQLPSQDHPSIADRYRNINNNMNKYVKEEEYERIIFIFECFLKMIDKYKNPWNGTKWW
ncbi:hypothetical protein ACFCP7_27450 [Paenibacillus elgii]